MLFEQRLWDGLADGSVTLAFRRWRRANAKPGGRQRIPTGVLAIDAVDVVTRDSITDADARRAGYGSASELRAAVGSPSDSGGEIYRIAFHFAGADPRAALRERADLSDAELEEIRRRLDRFDAASPRGAWTRATLAVISAEPAVRAPDLAASLGRDTISFKRDVRKLKELGLTESLKVGYRLAPRGVAVLRALSTP